MAAHPARGFPGPQTLVAVVAVSPIKLLVFPLARVVQVSSSSVTQQQHLLL
jgi:hypothetical protein